MTEPLSVTVIGGYLGAGKTTLVNHLLRHANGRRLAVLVNEFGALPIDEDLIEAQSEDLISIAGGCICCSFGSDMTAALMDLAALNPRPDHVVIESSGVAMPGAIGASIGLLEAYRLAGVVVLADSETVQRQAADEYLGDTTLRQLSDAHVIVQTKVDLVASDVRDGVRDWLAVTNPRAAIVPCEQGQVPLAVALGDVATDVPLTVTEHADASFESQVFAVSGTPDAGNLAASLATGGFGVVRAKGFVKDDAGQVHLVQVVGSRSEVTVYGGQKVSEVVCIGLAGMLDTEGLSRLFAGTS